MARLLLFDVIDKAQAEQMLQQHDRYEFGRLAVQRCHREIVGHPRHAYYVFWRVYYRGKEVRDAIDVIDNAESGFPTLADALAFLKTPNLVERLEKKYPQSPTSSS